MRDVGVPVWPSRWPGDDAAPQGLCGALLVGPTALPRAGCRALGYPFGPTQPSCYGVCSWLPSDDTLPGLGCRQSHAVTAGHISYPRHSLTGILPQVILG